MTALKMLLRRQRCACHAAHHANIATPAPCHAHCHVCHTQVNDGTGVGGDEEFAGEEEEDDEELFPVTSTELTGMMEAGAAMLTRFESRSQQATQESDYNDPAFEKEAVRKQHFKGIAGSTWAQKKVDGKKGEMGKLVKQHQKSMRELSQPMRNLILEMPAKKDSLTVMSGIFQEAVYNAEVRQAIFDASDVLKQQVSPAWQGSMLSLA